MKTAISLPDIVFDQADQLAHQLGLSRSELYARAVAAFVEAHQDQHVMEALNEIYATEDSSLDPVVAGLQTSSISHEVW